LNVDRLNTYNYINGFILSETGSGGANPAPVVNAGTDESITVPVNSVQLNGSASDANGFIFSYSWTKISGPTSFSFDNTAVNNPVISNLVEGSYTFRLTAFDNQGASSFDDVMVVVHPTVVPARLVKVNIYGGINPYNHPEWNNWNTNASLSSGNLKYSDGIVSSINAVLSQQSGISDNGTPYNVSMCPLEVGRYASYSSANRTLVISGLNNTRTYNIEIYASRKGVSNNSSRFAIAASSTDIATDNNLINKAVFISLTPVGGQIILNISRLNTYNYINGFVVTENAAAATLTASRVVAEKELSPASVGIFPNPVLENVTVEINNQQRGQMKVQIVDMSGKVLKQFIVNKTHSGIEAFSFSVNDLSQGTYIIRMQIEKWTENKKMVKY
ncbi:MAG: PKD domain-containing protein, partial [Flavisolibacter sp.]